MDEVFFFGKLRPQGKFPLEKFHRDPEKKKWIFFGLLRTIRPDVGPSIQQKLHIRKDHIQPKKFGKKKLSNCHALTGELAVKLEHFWLL